MSSENGIQVLVERDRIVSEESTGAQLAME